MSLFDDDHDAGRHRGRRGAGGLAAAAGAVALAFVVVILLVGGTLIGLRGGAGEPDELREQREQAERRERAERAGMPAPRTVVTAASTTIAPVASRAEAVLDHTIRVTASGAALNPPPVLDRLQDGDVVDVRASGFLANASGMVSICESLERRASRCGHRFPVRTDDGGEARFQYQLDRDGACGRTSGCVLVVEVDEVRGLARLVFGDRATVPASVTVTPAARPAARAAVEVVVAGSTPGAAVVVVQCPAGVTTIAVCTRASGDGAVRVEDDGTAMLTAQLAPSTRQLVVVDESGLAIAPAVTVQRPPGLSVDYDAGRAVGGILLAVVLAAVAVVLVRSTDWRAPAEAATPELDAAPLTEG